jgi:hypothetical protein
MKSFKQYLKESDTSNATNAEMAIVYHYNMIKYNKDHEKSLEIGEISPKNFAKLTDDLLEIGLKIATQMGNRGDHLTHAGHSVASKNYYEGGRDKTSKADFYGDNKNLISLKKGGDKGAGAQLMSAKSAEASGVFTSAMLHLKTAENIDYSANKDFQNALKTLQVEMEKTARNDLNVEVGSGKRDFNKWYSTESPRFKMLSKKFPPKKVQAHLSAELSIMGATTSSKNAYRNIIKELPKITNAQFKAEKDAYIKDDQVKIGNVMVSAKHLEKVDPKKLEQGALKKQISEIIDVSINSTKWQNQLTKFFQEHDEMKMWMVYEAASGLYKFTGQSSDGNNYLGDNVSVANKILVFDDNGIQKEHKSIIEYAKTHTNLIDKISVSYKGAGRSKYVKVGLANSIEHNLPTLMEEIGNLERQFYLTEGIFSDMKSKVIQFAKKVKDKIIAFVKKIIDMFINSLTKIASSKGLNAFFDMIGLSPSGNFQMKTPDW